MVQKFGAHEDVSPQEFPHTFVTVAGCVGISVQNEEMYYLDERMHACAHEISN